MGKKIGIVICNFNKEAYIVNCIKSVLESTCQDFDVYVVDNASTDNSVPAIKAKYEDKVCLIENPVNTGGSGGFNRGLKEALLGDYEYLMLVDNDIVMDPKCIEELYHFMEHNPEVGLVGAEIYKMDYPEIIMALGSEVDYKNYSFRDCYRDKRDTDGIPEVNYCDYVPACTLMVRRSVVDEVGIMDERNFIYWDDIDWGTRIKRAGHKVAAITAAKVWHKGGGTAATNTFPTYYITRNGMRYFSKYLPEDKLDEYVEYVLENMYQRIFGSYIKGKSNYIASYIRAVEDCFNGVTGKAAEDAIKPLIDEHNKLRALMEKCETVLIRLTPECEEDEYIKVSILIDYFEKNWTDKKLYFSYSMCLDSEEALRKVLDKNFKNDILLVKEEEISEKVDVEFTYCKHVRTVENPKPGECFIDCSTNILVDEEDFVMFRNYQINLNIFKFGYRDYVKRGIEKMRHF